MNQLYSNGILLKFTICYESMYLSGLLFRITFCIGYAQLSSFANSMCCFPYAFIIVLHDSNTTD